MLGVPESALESRESHRVPASQTRGTGKLSIRLGVAEDKDSKGRVGSHWHEREVLKDAKGSRKSKARRSPTSLVCSGLAVGGKAFCSAQAV